MKLKWSSSSFLFTSQFDGTWWFLLTGRNTIFAWLDLHLPLRHILQAHLLAMSLIFFFVAYISPPELKLSLFPNSHHLAMVKHQHLLIKYQPVCPCSQCPPRHTRHRQLHNPAVMVLCMLHRHHQPVCIPQSWLSHSQQHIQSTPHRSLQDLVHLEAVLGQATWNLQPKHHIQHHQVEGKDIVRFTCTWLVMRLCYGYSESRAFYGHHSFILNCNPDTQCPMSWRECMYCKCY